MFELLHLLSLIKLIKKSFYELNVTYIYQYIYILIQILNNRKKTYIGIQEVICKNT